MASSDLRRNFYLAFDWDETLTVQDSLAALKNICRARDTRLDRLGNRHQHPSGKEIDKVWDGLVHEYLKDRAAHKAKHFPREIEVDADRYRTWLRSLSLVEDRSIERVKESRLFAGVRREDVVEGARQAVSSGQVQLRQGWETLFRLIKNTTSRHTTLGVVSVNWSATFIRHCLLEVARSPQCTASRDDDDDISLIDFICNEVSISANEIGGLDAPDGSDGSLVGGLHSSSAKVHEFLSSGSPCSNRTSVYIGDSTTDFECLIRADVGIWLRDAPESSFEQDFLKTFAPYKTEVKALSQSHGDDVGLRWTPNLTMVADYLLSLGRSD